MGAVGAFLWVATLAFCILSYLGVVLAVILRRLFPPEDTPPDEPEDEPDDLASLLADIRASGKCDAETYRKLCELTHSNNPLGL